jgi:26S proteasome regulatory subunit N7
METAGKAKLESLDERLKEAEKTEGKSEISDALREKADHFTKIRDKVCGGFLLISVSVYFPLHVSRCLSRLFLMLALRWLIFPYLQDRAIEAQKLALTKTPGLGSKIDIVLTLVRIGFFFGGHKLVTEHLTKAEECVPPNFLNNSYLH